MKHTPIKKSNRYGKFNHSSTDEDKILDVLRKHPATAAMVEAVTGIRHCSICRYKRSLEKGNRLWQLFKKRCQITGYPAWYLTADPTTIKSFKKRHNG